MTQIAWDQLNGTQMLEALQRYCVENGASDLHLSPEKESVRADIRLHGIIHNLLKMDFQKYGDLKRRIKFVSKLKMNISNQTQDGQYVFGFRDRTVNVRVATLPSRFEESLTLRFLDPEKGIRPISELGIPAEIEKTLQGIIQAPHGLFLVTGPTGSGKTTTLYALINEIKGKERNIITLEDPIEYELEGIVQCQVDPDHNLTFSTGLRSILRHDPDVILVGEIRDFETAQTAIDAALTGHLVLSTLHTNSAIEAIPRLLSMGVTPYTFAPSLRAVLAQRLVRTLDSDIKVNESQTVVTNDMYNGRTSIAECLLVNGDIRELILLNESAAVLEKKARENGFRPMLECGMELVKKGKTTKQEVYRVTMV